MPFEKLKAVDGSVACLTCGMGARSDLDMDRTIAVGFGSAGYMRDGKVLWDENHPENRTKDFDDYPKVQDVENLAKAQPDSDWRIYFEAPLYSALYQRQGDSVWILVGKGNGFA